MFLLFLEIAVFLLKGRIFISWFYAMHANLKGYLRILQTKYSSKLIEYFMWNLFADIEHRKRVKCANGLQAWHCQIRHHASKARHISNLQSQNIPGLWYDILVSILIIQHLPNLNLQLGWHFPSKLRTRKFANSVPHCHI